MFPCLLVEPESSGHDSASQGHRVLVEHRRQDEDGRSNTCRDWAEANSPILPEFKEEMHEGADRISHPRIAEQKHTFAEMQTIGHS